MLLRTLIIQKIIFDSQLVRTSPRLNNRQMQQISEPDKIHMKAQVLIRESAQYLIGTLNDFRLSARRSLASAIAAVAVELNMISDTRLISLILIVTLPDKLGKETNQLMEYMRNSCEIRAICPDKQALTIYKSILTVISSPSHATN